MVVTRFVFQQIRDDHLWQWQLMPTCFAVLTELRHNELCQEVWTCNVYHNVALFWHSCAQIQSKADISTLPAATKYKMPSPDLSKVHDKASSIWVQRARHALSSHQRSYEHGEKQGWCGPRQHL